MRDIIRFWITLGFILLHFRSFVLALYYESKRNKAEASLCRIPRQAPYYKAREHYFDRRIDRFGKKALKYGRKFDYLDYLWGYKEKPEKPKEEPTVPLVAQEKQEVIIVQCSVPFSADIEPEQEVLDRQAAVLLVREAIRANVVHREITDPDYAYGEKRTLNLRYTMRLVKPYAVLHH